MLRLLVKESSMFRLLFTAHCYWAPKAALKKRRRKKVGLFLLFLSTYDTINSHIKMQSVYTGKLFLDQRLIKLINNELLCTSKESMETHKSNVLFTHK